jgi:hypothetical protein
MAVADLLAESLIAHERAKQLRRNPSTRAEAKIVLALARDLRLEALAEDPERTNPAWAAERVPHADMMQFYVSQLGDD